MRQCGWSSHKTRRVLAGYKKFLELKRDLKDWDHKILSPSIPVEMMWHQHILDVGNYIKDCELLCGQLVNHNPDSTLDVEARLRRVETTKHILKSQLGELDEEVWNFGGGDESSRKRPRDEDAEIEDLDAGEIQALQRQESRSIDATPEKLRILIRGPIFGERTGYKISRTTKMGNLFRVYAERNGVCPSTLRFIIDGARVDEDDTAEIWEMKDGDMIDARLELRG
jgi:hypothetical protein